MGKVNELREMIGDGRDGDKSAAKVNLLTKQRIVQALSEITTVEKQLWELEYAFNKMQEEGAYTRKNKLTKLDLVGVGLLMKTTDTSLTKKQHTKLLKEVYIDIVAANLKDQEVHLIAKDSQLLDWHTSFHKPFTNKFFSKGPKNTKSRKRLLKLTEDYPPLRSELQTHSEDEPPEVLAKLLATMTNQDWYGSKASSIK